MTDSYSRRRLLRVAGVAAAGAVAGCGGSDESTEDTETSDDRPSPDPTPADTPADTPDGAMDGPPSVDEFLAETDNYDGIVDMTGSTAVNIDVGVEANGAFYGFGPAAVRVDSGTEVTWTWTGQGGIHNVEARHGAEFRSEQMSGEGETFSQTFEESGTILYVCGPHEGIGMKGAVVVE
jgi:halocyanin-like protein